MNRSMRMLLLIPGLLFLTVFMLIPLVLTISSTFVENGSFSLDGYFRFLGDAYFLEILWNSFCRSINDFLLRHSCFSRRLLHF